MKHDPHTKNTSFTRSKKKPSYENLGIMIVERNIIEIHIFIEKKT